MLLAVRVHYFIDRTLYNLYVSSFSKLRWVSWMVILMTCLSTDVNKEIWFTITENEKEDIVAFIHFLSSLSINLNIKRCSFCHSEFCYLVVYCILSKRGFTNQCYSPQTQPGTPRPLHYYHHPINGPWKMGSIQTETRDVTHRYVFLITSDLAHVISVLSLTGVSWTSVH